MKEFKLIVAGGRDFNDKELMDQTIKTVIAELPDDCVVSIVSGMANGADALGYEWALHNKCKVYKHYAEWNKYGKRAGYIRNQEMCDNSQGLLAFHSNKINDKGTRHMIQCARNKGLYIKVSHY